MDDKIIEKLEEKIEDVLNPDEGDGEAVEKLENLVDPEVENLSGGLAEEARLAGRLASESRIPPRAGFADGDPIELPEI